MGVFEGKGAELRREHGSRGVTVRRDSDDEHRVVLLFDWDRDRIERFLSDEAVRETMRSGGAKGPPELTSVDKIADLPA